MLEKEFKYFQYRQDELMRGITTGILLLDYRVVADFARAINYQSILI